MVTVPQPGLDRLVVDSKEQSAKLVDHVIWTVEGPTRAMFSHGTGAIMIFVIAMYHMCPQAQ